MLKKAAFLVCLFAVTSSTNAASALTPADYSYLDSIGFDRQTIDDYQLSQAWASTIHNTINDPKTANDKKAREAAVNKTMDALGYLTISCVNPDYRKKALQQCESLHDAK